MNYTFRDIWYEEYMAANYNALDESVFAFANTSFFGYEVGYFLLDDQIPEEVIAFWIQDNKYCHKFALCFEKGKEIWKVVEIGKALTYNAQTRLCRNLIFEDDPVFDNYKNCKDNTEIIAKYLYHFRGRILSEVVYDLMDMGSYYHASERSVEEWERNAHGTYEKLWNHSKYQLRILAQQLQLLLDPEGPVSKEYSAERANLLRVQDRLHFVQKEND